MWFKVSDDLHDHRKIRGLDAAAVGLWCLAGSWSGDGFVPASVVPRWTRQWKRHAAALVAKGLWEEATVDGEAGWRFVNWAEYQPSREEANEPLERIRWRRKQALKKDRSLCEAIVARDRGMCRYCGVRVNWQDRRGPSGGTYDHVDPDGDNSLANVVVACRRCNGRKKDRTPHEAGIVLLPEPEPYQAPSGSLGAGSDPVPSGSTRGSAREAVPEPGRTGSDLVGSTLVEPDRAPVQVPSTNGSNGVHS